MHGLDTLIFFVLQQTQQPAAKPPLSRAVWLLLAIGVGAIVLARVMVMMNRATLCHLSDDSDAPTRSPRRTSRRPTDAWAEAGRRVPLEDDPDVPREPPDEPPPKRGFQ